MDATDARQQAIEFAVNEVRVTLLICGVGKDLDIAELDLALLRKLRATSAHLAPGIRCEQLLEGILVELATIDRLRPVVEPSNHDCARHRVRFYMGAVLGRMR